MSNFWKRALTGSLFLVVMIGGIIWCYWSLCVLFFIIVMLGLNEFYGLVEQSNVRPQRKTGMGLGALVFIMMLLEPYFGAYFILTLIMPFVAAIFFAELYRKLENPFSNIALTLLGIIYVVLPFALWARYESPYNSIQAEPSDSLLSNLLTVRHMHPYSYHLVLGFFFMLWTNDTGAYLSGMALGRHKLWERISPKKTWEGFIGGVLLSIGVGYVISLYYKEIGAAIWMILGLIIGVFGTLGDLVKSLLKRSINVKDSGTLLPGHGGILDRFDGVLLSTYFVLGFLYIVNFINQILNY